MYISYSSTHVLFQVHREVLTSRYELLQILVKASEEKEERGDGVLSLTIDLALNDQNKADSQEVKGTSEKGFRYKFSKSSCVLNLLIIEFTDLTNSFFKHYLYAEAYIQCYFFDDFRFLEAKLPKF